MTGQEIKITPEIKSLAKEYSEECPYLHNKEDVIELAERIKNKETK